MNANDQKLMDALNEDLRRSGWAGVDEREAERLAIGAVQMLADSDPDDDAIEAMERLKGTPQEHLFCLDASTLERVIATTISNAIYDAKAAVAAAAPSASEAPPNPEQWDDELTDLVDESSASPADAPSDDEVERAVQIWGTRQTDWSDNTAEIRSVFRRVLSDFLSRRSSGTSASPEVLRRSLWPDEMKTLTDVIVRSSDFQLTNAAAGNVAAGVVYYLSKTAGSTIPAGRPSPSEPSDDEVHAAVMWFYQGNHLMEEDAVAHELMRVTLSKLLERRTREFHDGVRTCPTCGNREYELEKR